MLIVIVFLNAIGLADLKVVVRILAVSGVCAGSGMVESLGHAAGAICFVDFRETSELLVGASVILEFPTLVCVGVERARRGPVVRRYSVHGIHSKWHRSIGQVI